ncbi:hypothetical protein BUALT_Bualt17G0098100 [Buddleja alternifolia]|uniref:LOB domain-containing protein n=1 Tax=Buddleja alternifolia TaxID=168488 RepID=A0AAV6W7H9_9LAMI|nr:hypothetical protein BUALT_Bualt17G0098100 [Buddleja alternifolia]
MQPTLSSSVKSYGTNIAILPNLLIECNFNYAAIFKSLLFEACGRIINPVYGSVGLMCSGDWPRCQAAVEAVLGGAPLMTQVSGDDDDSSNATQQQCPIDIRHLSKEAAAAASLHRVRTRKRFKRSKTQVDSTAAEFTSESESKFTITGWEQDQKNNFFEEMLIRAPSHDSFSVETVEPALVKPEEQPVQEVKPEAEPIDIGLELTLGFNPVFQAYLPTVIEISDSEA